MSGGDFKCFSMRKWFSQSLDLSPIQQIWDEVELEFIANVVECLKLEGWMLL